ncbi:exodeoxyribonuclease V subunit gamma [Geoalkalibacter sp.]|uniref:exodeoxyribonuclease V subunit gamma n=1 Tax=Geoalkalibacter sp. TaxID=3041440 RepID=UPI00272EBB10|nr:exodeoxyribonuclease V subunit gamma [Geoalkalibacter sp.]
MSGFHLFLSNRLELLFDELAGVLRTGPNDPLAPEIILVQSRGMQRWLSLRLAEGFGAWANDAQSFPFPNAFIWECIRQVLPGLEVRSSFDPGPLTWRILGLIPRLLERPAFAPVRGYFGSGADPLKSYQFARRLADLFDQYAVYRPELLRSWDQGAGQGEAAWQAELWRELVAASPGAHKAAVLHAFLDAARSPNFAAQLPRRVAVFGIPAMPPLHLAVFEALARHLDVHLFLLNPSREYWGDIVSAREAAKRKKQLSFDDYLGEALHLGAGHPLLASLGGQGRDFFRLLLERLEFEEHLCFSEPAEDTLLHCLQSDILLLRDRPEGNAPQLTLDEADGSVQVHSCHGPLREMEVLHDQLVELFARHPDLTPNDVLVMIPDIEAYAPYITAVFAGEAQGMARIPFRIADRGVRAQSPLAEAFLKLLALPGSRFGAAQILDILEIPWVRTRFELAEADLDQIREWVRETRIRWGIDAAHRARQGVPAYAENSWRAGLERLLLGHALPEDGGLFGGILPRSAVRGGNARVLGCFLDFIEALFALADDLARPRSPQDWAALCLQMLEQFLASDAESEVEIDSLRRALRELRESAEQAGYAEDLSLDVLRAHLTGCLEQSAAAQGFLAGGVTFCALLPMRSIPFRVIVLSGMNDGAFPRAERPQGFDLMARHPQPGDRSLRREDRYLFLEALVSARDYFILTYVGQNARDAGDVPPSVLVCELLDCIARGFRLSEGEILPWLVRKHHLQAFHPAYFSENARLFSYSRANCEALAARAAGVRAAVPLAPVALPPPAEDFQELDIHRLLRFVRHPQRFFLEERLGLRLAAVEDALAERETLEVGGLEKYQLMADLIDEHLRGAGDDARHQRFRARGLLPPGVAGQVAFAELDGAARGFVEVLRPLREEPPRHLDLDLPLPGARLTGRLMLGGRGGPLRYRYAKLKARDRLDAWLAHLAFCAQQEGGGETLLVGSEGLCRFAPLAPDRARELLAELLELFRQGLCRTLPLYPETSAAWAQKLLAGKGPEAALEAARKVWDGSDFARGESEDAWLRYSLRGVEPFGGEFEALALHVFGPLFAACEEVRP